MGFLRFIRRLLVGLFAFVGLLVVLAAAGAYFGWRYVPQYVDPVPSRAVLVLDLANGLVETLPDNPLARASLGDAVSVRDLVQGLQAAGRDDRVKGLVARLGIGDLGMARAQEVRDAVLAFRQQGKFAIAYAESFGEGGSGNTHYYLATAFEEVWLQPSGDVELVGVRLESPFLKDTLALLGVEAQMEQRQEYKGGKDMFTASSLPEPQRQNLQRLADSWLRQIAAGLALYRKMDIADALALIDRGPFAAAEAKAAGLVDRLAYWDEIDREIARRASDQAVRYAFADYVTRLPAPPTDAPRIALVYGLGPVQLSGGQVEPLFGNATMAADVVAGALADAIDDPGIAAIVFRIDSPGGSYVASDAIRREVERARDLGKPVVVSMGDVAASGGYFVAAPAHAIVAQPGTVTGSIGVFGGKLVVAGLWLKLGVGWDGVQAGANADIASMNRAYTPAGWAHLNASLDRIYADFTAKVALSRKLTAEQIDAAAKGQVWTGIDAKERGLVDELGGLATALALARSTAGIDAAAAISLEQFPAEGGGLERFLRRLLGIELRGLAKVAALAERIERDMAPIGRLVGAAEEANEPGLRMPEMRVD